MFHSLRFRFALICIGLAIGPLIIVGAIIGKRNFNTLEQQSLILQSKVAESVGSEIRGTIENWENELVLLDEVYGLGVLELKEQQAILSNTLLHQHAFQEVVLLNSEGQEQIRLSRNSVIVDDDLQSRAGNEEFLFPATSGGTYLGPVYFDDTIREPLATISVPVFNRSSGELVYVLVAESRFKAIWDLLNDLELASEEEVYVIDRAGLVVAHRHPAAVLSGTTIELPEVDGRAQGLSGTDVIVARHNLQLGNQELIVVAEQPVSNALELATNSLFVLAIAICAALAFAVILVIFTTRRIVRPIEALATSARVISDGDFPQQLEVSSQDEVGQLASAFNQMTSDLAESRKEIEQYTLELKANNKQLQCEITERKQAEEKIQRAEALYRNMVELSPDGIYMSDMKGTITSCNEAATRILGYSKDELVGKHFTKLGTLHMSDIPKYLKILSAVLSGKVIEPQEVSFYHKDGTNRVVDIRIILLRLDGKKAIQITARDITEHKRMEKALQEAYNELEKRVEERTRELVKANEGLQAEITERKQAEEREKQLQQELNLSSRLALIGEMASGIAHEINNPLTGVIGFAQLLMKKEIPDDIRNDLEVINSQSQRVAKIVENLLTFARQYKPGREYVDVNNVISQVLELRSYEMKTRNIEVESQLAPDLPQTMADSNQLQQVFLNIILNAEKEMIRAHNRGKLQIKTEKINHSIRVSITDDGPGISKENLDKIFDPFFTTREVGNGTGLGLSICHGIITQHKGRIYAKSELGKGATFVVELPIVADTGLAEKVDVIKEEPWKQSGAEILVVDDKKAIDRTGI